MDDVTVLADRATGVHDTPLAPVPQKTVRLTGIDVARGLAVLGMYAVHVGPDPAAGGYASFFRVFEGHSAALFAVLAGVSISLMSGGRNPKTGRARTSVMLRLGTRAPLLVALGLWLTNLDTGYLVILAYYGVCFLFAIPWLRFGAKVLASAAVVAAALFPFISFLIRAQIEPRGLTFLPPDLSLEDFGSSAAFLRGSVILLITGTFPALNLMTYIFAGMALGRLDLGSARVCRRLFFGGVAVAALGYLVSWIATDLLGGMNAIYRSLGDEAAHYGMTPEQLFSLNQTWIHGTPPTTTLAWELLPTGASYTPFDFVISIGIAAAVIGGCQLVAARFTRAVRPLADLGGRVLSAYVLHFVAISLLWHEGEEGVYSMAHFLEFSAVAILAAMAWRKWIGRGPLEWALHHLSNWPKFLLPAPVPARRG
ncbi:Protein of unknown function [Amycolatopsis xylanica]|uniref:Heparan-alpha-glucosaminide N-acetyltransferase catalytic domain-containing protein n=1 Tax=Amycolatopsis xylanica TaxID=589385 RepID=A0A1H3SMC6_9PSEU|nr:heparan-alpha-glucosaminide N-acetyltransferase domain-containing protein [Amycolatopsis xylanica]SDZ38870.1 Protein of unknown function [Amycolatopsis xylanica]